MVDDAMTFRTALLHAAAPRAFASQPVTAEMVDAARAARAVGTVDPSRGDEMLKRSPDSAAMLDYWDKVDAIIDGIEALRAEGQRYLPRFSDESDADYRFRLECTKLTNIFSDIAEGLTSKPFQESISLIKGEDGEETPPQSILDFATDVDGSGNNLTVFAAETFHNGVIRAIDWIFVDFSKPDPTVRTLADARRAGMRPFWSHVLGRNVLDVRSKVINGEETLTYFKVLEPGTPDHVRVFERSDDGVVTWTLYEKRDEPSPDGKTMFVAIDGGTISIGVIPMVPFITGRRNGRTWKIDPALKAAADLQIELYQQESDLKYAKKLTAFPMLAANGIMPEKGADGKPKKLAVGPNRVLYSGSDPNSGKIGNWTYVEPSAMSLEFLSKEVDKTIQNLRELGKQPLTAQSGNITVITAGVAAAKARSAVKAWAYKLKDTLENALMLTAKWLNITYDPIVHVFVDFDEYTEGEDIDALLAMSEKNKISDETLYEEMQRRAVLSSNFTTERERQRLLAQQPDDNGPDVNPDT
jgi:hypothetical protein